MGAVGDHRLGAQGRRHPASDSRLHPVLTVLFLTRSRDPDPPRDLSVALPVGMFLRQERIVRGGLDAPLPANGT